MKFILKTKIGYLTLLFGVLMISAASAAAQPNLRVYNWTGPNSAMVNTPYQYSVKVRNMGNAPAAAVKVKIDLPLTETSPQRYILGKVTGMPSGCAIVSNKVECNYATLGAGQHNTITFNLEYPVTTKPLSMTATGSTSTPNEINAANNTVTRTQAVTYPTNEITSSVNVLVSNCTGTNLTSFFECELFPSSQQSFTMTINQGGTLTIPYPGWSGTWSQPTNKRLEFTITDGVDSANFSGFASSTTCFEGMTNFSPASSYVSPYKVCIQ